MKARTEERSVRGLTFDPESELLQRIDWRVNGGEEGSTKGLTDAGIVIGQRFSQFFIIFMSKL